jgi:hypothetical protein
MRHVMSAQSLGLGLLAVGLVLTMPARPVAAQAQAAGKLKVTVNYTGQGTVDKTHQLIVWLFDTPDINAQSTPLATDVITENNGSDSFSGLPKTVYIAAAYNEKGDYDGTSGPPPAGTPVTIYGGEGTATGVATGGDDAAVTVAFDGSMRMQ